MDTKAQALAACYEKLHKFSLQHFAYINQIFGDITIRELIQEYYLGNKTTKHKGKLDAKHKKQMKALKLQANQGTGAFSDSHHHVIVKKTGEIEWCSASIRTVQHIKINLNDTLCQSYSLFEYLRRAGELDGIDDLKDMTIEGYYKNKKINTVADQRAASRENTIHNQMVLIKMYQKILGEKNLWKYIREQVFFPTMFENGVYWKFDEFSDDELVKMASDNSLFDVLFGKIENVIKDWENYGYWYFVGEGKCDKENADYILPGTLEILNRKKPLKKLVKPAKSATTLKISSKVRSHSIPHRSLVLTRRHPASI